MPVALGPVMPISERGKGQETEGEGLQEGKGGEGGRRGKK